MAKLNADRVVSLSAMLVSMGSLFIILYQTSIIRRAEQASVMPYLEIGLSLANQTQKITIRNTGLGPALIHAVQILDGEKVIFEGSPSEYGVSVLPDNLSGFGSFSQDLLLPGRLIPPNSGLVTFAHGTRGENGQFITENFKFSYNPDGRYIIAITYESVYGDRWMVTSNSLVRTEVE